MEQRKYLSFDPGGTTGWCIRDPGGHFRSGTFVDNEHHWQLWALLERELASAVPPMQMQLICERFNYQRRELDKGVSLVLVSREYIGVIKLFSQRFNIPLYMSQVSNKDFWTRNNLGTLKMDYKTQHERDAAAHLLWFLTFQEGEHDYIKRAKGPK